MNDQLLNYELELYRNRMTSTGRIWLSRVIYPETSTPWITYRTDSTGRPSDCYAYTEQQAGMALQDYLTRE
jgi:hypothetical protein